MDAGFEPGPIKLKAEARDREAKAKAAHFGLEVDTRSRGLTSLVSILKINLSLPGGLSGSGSGNGG